MRWQVSAIYKATQGTKKPEFVTQELFLKQHGERCPKCGSRDINTAQISTAKSELDQWCNCSRCETTWTSCYKLTGFRLPDKFCGEQQ